MKNGDILLLRVFNQQFQREEEIAYELRDDVLHRIATVPPDYFKNGIAGYTRVIRFQEDDGISGWYSKTRTNVQNSR